MILFAWDRYVPAAHIQRVQRTYPTIPTTTLTAPTVIVATATEVTAVATTAVTVIVTVATAVAVAVAVAVVVAVTIAVPVAAAAAINERMFAPHVAKTAVAVVTVTVTTTFTRPSTTMFSQFIPMVDVSGTVLQLLQQDGEQWLSHYIPTSHQLTYTDLSSLTHTIAYGWAQLLIVITPANYQLLEKPFYMFAINLHRLGVRAVVCKIVRSHVLALHCIYLYFMIQSTQRKLFNAKPAIQTIGN